MSAGRRGLSGVTVAVQMFGLGHALKRLLLLRHNRVNENLCGTEMYIAIVNISQTIVTVKLLLHNLYCKIVTVQFYCKIVIVQLLLYNFYCTIVTVSCLLYNWYCEIVTVKFLLYNCYCAIVTV